MTIERGEFIALFEIVYSHRLRKEKIHELFDLLDEERKEYLTLDNFFTLIDHIENNKNLTVTEWPENWYWAA